MECDPFHTKGSFGDSQARQPPFFFSSSGGAPGGPVGAFRLSKLFRWGIMQVDPLRMAKE